MGAFMFFEQEQVVSFEFDGQVASGFEHPGERALHGAVDFFFVSLEALVDFFVFEQEGDDIFGGTGGTSVLEARASELCSNHSGMYLGLVHKLRESFEDLVDSRGFHERIAAERAGQRFIDLIVNRAIQREFAVVRIDPKGVMQHIVADIIDPK